MSTASTTATPQRAEESVPWWQSYRFRNWLFDRGGDLLLLLLIAFALFPIFWMVVTSLKTNDEIVSNVLWPREPQWDNFVDMWDSVNFGLYYGNSLVICVSATLVATSFATFAGYALARFRFPGAGFFGTAVIGTQLVPGIMMMLPIYLTFREFTRVTGISLIGTLGGLTLLYIGFFIPLSLWILRSFFAAIPPDLEEAALIDGATRFGAFWRIALPLARPGIIATAIYVFLTAWDELFFAWVMDVQTIPVGIRLYIGQFTNRFDLMMAAGVVVTLPVLVIFFLLQRQMISGLTAGAVKG